MANDIAHDMLLSPDSASIWCWLFACVPLATHNSTCKGACWWAEDAIDSAPEGTREQLSRTSRALSCSLLPSSERAAIFVANSTAGGAVSLLRPPAATSALTSLRLSKQRTKRVSAAVARAIGGDPREVKAQTERELAARREEHRQSWMSRKKELARAHAEMKERIDSRPLMFEQASIDVAVERAKAAAHDKFDAALKKHGLASKLDP